MPVIAVVNRKGGSGKSTLATHLAAHFAHAGGRVLLGDADFQQSSHAWLRLRETQTLATVPRIAGWTLDPKHVQHAPQGFTHVVLDTPGGLEGYPLLRLVSLADALLLPVGASMFDRESATQCLAELQAHPRVKQGRCVLAAVGMRLDARTRAAAVLERWAAQRQVAYLGALRETQTYVKCLEHGLAIFDLPPARVAPDLAQWQPLLDWLAQAASAAEAATASRASRAVTAKGTTPSRPAPTPSVTQSLAAHGIGSDHPPFEHPQAAQTPPPPEGVRKLGSGPSFSQGVGPTPRAAEPAPARPGGGMAARIGRWFSALTPRRVR